MASTVALAACARRKAGRYQAWLFMASAEEKAIVVSDLSSFRRSGVIALSAVPDRVFSARGKVFAVCSEDQTVVQMNPLRRSVTGTIATGGRIAAVALSADEAWLAVAISQPAAIVLIDTATGKVARRAPLTVAPLGIAASATQLAVLLATGKSTSLARLSLPDGTLLGVSAIGANAVSAIGYRKDGETIFVGADTLEIISFSSATGAVLARLPVPIRPTRFCVDGGGGQVFVTGADKDPRLVIFSPYQNQIDQTLYAGRALDGMAVAPSRNLLFLANPTAGEVTIMNIDTRKIIAAIRTGGSPGEILIAPTPGTEDEEYAFVVDRETGDVSALHIPVVLQKSDAFIAEHPRPVFAVFHGGGKPQSAVIVPYS